MQWSSVFIFVFTKQTQKDVDTRKTIKWHIVNVCILNILACVQLFKRIYIIIMSSGVRCRRTNRQTCINGRVARVSRCVRPQYTSVASRRTVFGRDSRENGRPARRRDANATRSCSRGDTSESRRKPLCASLSPVLVSLGFVSFFVPRLSFVVRLRVYRPTIGGWTSHGTRPRVIRTANRKPLEPASTSVR